MTVCKTVGADDLSGLYKRKEIHPGILYGLVPLVVGIAFAICVYPAITTGSGFVLSFVVLGIGLLAFTVLALKNRLGVKNEFNKYVMDENRVYIVSIVGVCMHGEFFQGLMSSLVYTIRQTPYWD